MNRKRLLPLAIFAVSAAALVLPGRPAVAADPVIVKIATVVPKNSVWQTCLQDMADDWKKQSNGQVQVRLYAGGVAGDDSDVVRKIKLGTLDGSLLSITGLHIIDHSVSAVTVPLMFDNYDEFYTVLEQMRPELEKKYEAQGFIVLNWADAGWVHFLTKEPVKTPDDLRKLKIFTWQDDASGASDLWKSAGFNPVPLPSTEITTALQTGLITALPTSAEPASLLQWNQHAKYMTNINWAVLIGATVISKKTWDKIPADLQPKLRASALKAGENLRSETRKADAGAIQAMKDRGMTVIEPDVDAWHKTVEPTWTRMRGTLVPDEMFDKVKAARDAYRAKNGTKKADASSSGSPK